MIEIVSAPAINRTLLDGNSSVITFKSTNGESHYLKAIVFVDDTPFDELNISKTDNYQGSFDFKKLYAAYFKTEFTHSLQTDLVHLPALRKKINITIAEYEVATNAITHEVQVPTFYIIHNQHPVAFNDLATVAFLDYAPAQLQAIMGVPLRFPLWLRQSDYPNNLNITVIDDLGNEHVNITKQVLAHGVYYFNLVLPATLSYFASSVTVTFTHGATVITKDVVLVKNQPYAPKQIVFKNNFGVYLYAYLFGKNELGKKIDAEVITLTDNTRQRAEVNTATTFKIYSSYLLETERPILTQIAESLDCLLLYYNAFKKALVTTRKLADFEEKNHLNEEVLTFEIEKSLSQDNSFAFVKAPTQAGFEASIDQNQPAFLIADLILSGYTDPEGLPALHFKITDVGLKGALKVQHGGIAKNVVLNQEYNFINFDGLIYTPIVGEHGEAYNVIKFKTSNGGIYSNEAAGIINVNEIPDANQPPVINTDTAVDVTVGDPIVLSAVVTDPEGDPVTVFWEQIGGSGLTIQDEATATPTITGFAAAGNYTVRITARDTVNNLITTRDVVITAIDDVVYGDVYIIALNSPPQQTTFIKIANGKPGEEITVTHNGFFTHSLQDIEVVIASLINGGNNVTLTDGQPSYAQTFVFDESGEINYTIDFNFNSTQSSITYNADIYNYTGPNDINLGKSHLNLFLAP